MANISFDEIVKLAEQLPQDEQNKLIYHLRVKQISHKTQAASVPFTEASGRIADEWFLKRGSEYVDFYRNPTREELIDEHNNLRDAGIFGKVESLYGKYANPYVPELSAEAFHAELHAIATEWEQELDDFDSNDD
jgi:hypothetical protein